jgi:hypothetical protein
MKKETPEAVGQGQAQPQPQPTRRNVAEMTLLEQINQLNKAHEVIHAAEKEIATQRMNIANIMAYMNQEYQPTELRDAE